MRTCLSSFSDFFKDLTCIPHDTVKNVEETKPLSLNEVKDNPSKEEPVNTIVDKDENAEVDDLESVYDDTIVNSKDSRSTSVEVCIVLAPLVLGAFYSYMMVHLIQTNIIN
jgi:hypothetical protein